MASIRSWRWRCEDGFLLRAQGQVALHCLWCFDHRQQPSKPATDRAITEQAAHHTLLPELLANAAGGRQLLQQQRQQRLLQGLQLAGAQAAAVG